MLDRLTRYLRRAAHAPTTLAAVEERTRSIQAHLHGLSKAAECQDGVASSSGDEPAHERLYLSSAHAALKPEHVVGATLFADRVDALVRVPQHGCIAEIGVAAGDFTEAIVRTARPKRFDAFDVFRLHELSHLWGRSTEEWFGGRSHREFYESRFEREISDGVIEVFEGDSSPAMAHRPDNFYDMIYLDGDHSYDGVRRDAEASIPKLKPDGLLVFNDYTMMDHVSQDPYGIVPVVNDMCAAGGWRVDYFAFQPQLFCDIALRRAQ